MQPIRLAISVTGRVQGVGFRFFTVMCAGQKHLTGWVRNRFDGAVEMEVQGPPEAIEVFQKKIREGPVLARVNEMVVTELPLVEREKGFTVRH